MVSRPPADSPPPAAAAGVQPDPPPATPAQASEAAPAIAAKVAKLADAAATATSAAAATAVATEAQDPLAQALAPVGSGLLDSVEEARKRALIRSRLFGPPKSSAEADPVRIGRFVPLRRLGAGGMGVVYVAYDAQLRREVAVKLLRSSDEDARARLLREAQALAQVTHPNIVTIYEVGESQKRVFIAMELVAGLTLRDALREPRPWSEIVAIFRQAGQGLWAVHQHGLVHRDFKPENVMVGDDGRVRIVDFGLARRLTPPDLAAPESEAASVPVGVTSALPSRVSGTPLYMAPEQYDPSVPPDSRSDQFAFCVALFEALYGQRPFPGSTPAELVANMEAGRRVELPKAARAAVPDWLHSLLLRGLSYQPEARFASMAELLQELGRDRQTLRRRAGWLAAMLLLAGLSLLLGRKWQVSESERCQQGPARIAEVWGAGEHAALHALRQGTQSEVAQGQWRRSEALLDRYGASWSAMYSEACRAHQRREQSDELFELRMRCLEQRRAQLRATVEVLHELGRAEEAVEVVSGLEPLTGCADVSELRAALQLPEQVDTRGSVVALRAALGRAEVEERAGRYAQALAIAQQVLQQSEAIGYAPLTAEARFQCGAQASRLGRYEAAATSLEQAFVQATSTRHDQLAGQAANLLLYIRGHRQAKLEVASAWEKIAAALLQRRDNNHKLAVDFFGNRGLLRTAQGDLPQALADFQHALLAAEALYGPGHMKYARMLGSRAQVYFAQRDYASARRDQERALAIREENLGHDHPVIASSLNALSLTLLKQGELRSAETLVRRALAIQQRALGAEHPDVAATQTTLGEVLLSRAQYSEAETNLKQALAIRQSALGIQHPTLAPLLLRLGQLSLRQGRPGLGCQQLQRAVALYAGEPPSPASTEAQRALAQAQPSCLAAERKP